MMRFGMRKQVQHSDAVKAINAKIRAAEDAKRAKESEERGLQYKLIDTILGGKKINEVSREEYSAAWDKAEKDAKAPAKVMRAEIATMRENLKALEAERKAIIAGEKGEAKARKEQARTERTEECQVCEARWCATKAGLLVHHGYTRPGYGFIQGDCYGVGHKPFPATDALESYLGALKNMLANTEKSLATLDERDTFYKEVDVRDEHGRLVKDPITKRFKTESVPVKRGEDGFEKLRENVRANLKADVVKINKEITRVTARIAEGKRRQAAQ